MEDREQALHFETIRVAKPEEVNVVLGQAHFIKTIDDLHEALARVAPPRTSASLVASRRDHA